MMGGYTENPEKVKIRGWALAQVWVLAWDNTVLAKHTHRHMYTVEFG